MKFRRLVRTARTGAWHLRKGGLNQFRRWQQRQGTDSRNPRISEAGSLLERYHPIGETHRAPAFASVRVGVILDDFSALAFAYEWDTVPLSRKGWREELQSLDFVFIESAWNGNGGQWQYQLTGESGLKADARELLATCRELGIPTVFWNKEDPPHFEDFLEAASLCDHVFTSDSRLIDDYRTQLGHDRVGPLSFAAQPAIHNPVRPAGPRREEGAAFAGMYFAHKYPERREQMDWLLGGAADAAHKAQERFTIFSRQHGGDDKYQFPGELAAHVIGSLPYDRMPNAYKDFALFLNVNSVVDSPSMCARRIFEVTASGTPVVSAPSAATRRFFPVDEVFQPAGRTEAAHTVRALMRSPELRDRSVHLAQRRIWGEHTYSHRAMQIMDVLSIPYDDPTVSTATVIVSTNRPHQVDHVLQSVAKQTGVVVQLSLLTHGFELVEDDVRSRAASMGLDDVILRAAPSSLSLGECLNLAIESADGDVIAKFDDDDYYGEHYLLDQIHALHYSAADLVGKQAHYMHLEDTGAVLLRFPEREHKFTKLVMGPTMVGRREAFTDIRFRPITRGEDTTFQRELIDSGGAVYSADRFNFVQVRKDDGAHTWTVEQSELLANSVVHGFGLAPEHHFF
ncbi:glycosyltransferase family protein [Brevibacterium jeotgali]|uniref:Spore maturation protein CgeB n=1 Tax=Brevibacterium jeotgali TaxID=1262550 RepID=A0A2H1L7G4_9MICO|nr:glycosyltransferase [Brevibacterium jeotgali]TWC03417.1 spore maturation protein CgeB [Brevibacterium jeotgali]SMY12846.1 Spore maturation protein CgeB [Brevibacterium jeotgali]